MKKNELYIGLDVHKETIAVALAEDGRNGEVRNVSTIPNDLYALERLLRRLRGTHEATVHVCYEAGPCGFVIARRLAKLGIDCVVVAPSLIPKKSGDRIKTDKRDAANLARLLRSGDLKPIYVPDPTDEAIRDLCRARTDAVEDRTRARQRIKAFLLRNGYSHKDERSWTPGYMRYLREVQFSHQAMKVIQEDYLHAIEVAQERVNRCEKAMQELLADWQLRPAVEALMGFRGFRIVAAMILVSEIGNITRFLHPRHMMAYLGLVPSESTSSDKRRQGGITKCGNPHARWILIESAQNYAQPPRVGKDLAGRQEGQSQRIKEVSWRAQNRLHLRFKKLQGRKLQRNKAIVAVSRELIGFIWEALRELPCYVQNHELSKV